MANPAYSMANWGYSPPINQYTGQPDNTAGLFQSPAEPNVTLGAAAGGADPSMWDSFSSWLGNSGVLNKTAADGSQTQGWGMPALNLASGLTNAYFGYKQLGLAKDTLDQNKKQFQLNFDAQKKTTNASLADRQTARVASNPNAYQSVSSYMNKYGI